MPTSAAKATIAPTFVKELDEESASSRAIISSVSV